MSGGEDVVSEGGGTSLNMRLSSSFMLARSSKESWGVKGSDRMC